MSLKRRVFWVWWQMQTPPLHACRRMQEKGDYLCYRSFTFDNQLHSKTQRDWGQRLHMETSCSQLLKCKVKLLALPFALRQWQRPIQNTNDWRCVRSSVRSSFILTLEETKKKPNMPSNHLLSGSVTLHCQAAVICSGPSINIILISS